MIVTYPIVNDRGELTGAEVTCRFGDIYAIEHMSRWVRHSRTSPTSDIILNDEHYELVPGCVIISLHRNEFNVQANYAELKAQLIAINEWAD